MFEDLDRFGDLFFVEDEVMSEQGNIEDFLRMAFECL